MAERWVDYWSDGQAVFTMSAEEDSGYLQALTLLSQAKIVDINRVMVLRSASDFTIPPPGQPATQLLFCGPRSPCALRLPGISQFSVRGWQRRSRRTGPQLGELPRPHSRTVNSPLVRRLAALSL